MIQPQIRFWSSVFKNRMKNTQGTWNLETEFPELIPKENKPSPFLRVVFWPWAPCVIMMNACTYNILKRAYPCDWQTKRSKLTTSACANTQLSSTGGAGWPSGASVKRAEAMAWRIFSSSRLHCTTCRKKCQIFYSKCRSSTGSLPHDCFPTGLEGEYLR